MKTIDLVIIGGGSAGMAAAIEAKKNGIDNLLIIEKDNCLGGILNQCIHSGFGIHELKEELTGPEYAYHFIKEVNDLKIPYILNSYVIDITKDKKVTYSNSESGVVEIMAKAIIISTGCYERNAGAINLSGDRCSGVITAGTAQYYLNIHGFLVGKKVVILGSGDIGLIMARRLTLEGAKVVCVAELMPYSNGLNRNIAQCLNDFNIPLYLSTSVSNVKAKNGRLDHITLASVDEKGKFIEGTERDVECDTLILSVGLVPYIPLLEKIDCKIGINKGPEVNNKYETSIEGIFCCGNSLHVHDIVDFVTKEGKETGLQAANYINNKDNKDLHISLNPGANVSYVVPSKINSNEEKYSIKFRVRKPIKECTILLKENNEIFYKINKPYLIPSEMISLDLSKEVIDKFHQNIVVEIEAKQ